MAEAIKEFFASPEIAALITAGLSFLAANLSTIIIFAVKYIGLKKSEIKQRLEHDEIVQALESKYGQVISELERKIDDKLDKVTEAVLDKMEQDELIKREQIEQETLQLQEAINATKSALSKDIEE